MPRCFPKPYSLPQLWAFCTVLLVSSCAARPLREPGEFRAPELVELQRLDPTIRLDIRYATSRNFAGRAVYTEARAFLQRPAAEALVRVNRELAPLGYCLLVFDGYRPWSVTKLFWDLTPPEKKEFVADPKKGSRHNRGCAVDLSLWDIAANKEVAMPGEYDEMSPRSYAAYAGGTPGQRAARDLLRRHMEAHGFAVLPAEWWHFDYQDWKAYPIQNIPFEKL
ncbi:M15 family metallopeptidase [Hymenobacter ruricola]|uniref:D-alanyl-D-alanine dipeptidase n=1 Tax=Hymenobacter ruricola TaxID=2791023 RepID=A0ABS0I8A4_9BACT|nr:M15 family metallopeptidase [Hymenobacter ruricola]MBF9223193.1 M15 family metallopeptidase [Hymenobacter ruricola]